MDTDDLSVEAYKGIMITAEKLHRDLMLQFAVLAEECNNDDEFLNECEAIIKDWINVWGLDELLEEIFCEKPPTKVNLTKTLEQIQANISSIRMTPMDKRTYDV